MEFLFLAVTFDTVLRATPDALATIYINELACCILAAQVYSVGDNDGCLLSMYGRSGAIFAFAISIL